MTASIYPFNLEFTAAGKSGVSLARFPFIMDGLRAPEISCAISSRSAGDMRVFSDEPCPTGRDANPCRQRVFEALNLEYGRVSFLQQIHSREVLEAGRETPRPGDGLVSRDQRVCLSVTVADCLPVYLYDSATGAFGLLHSGWKGTGIVLDTLELMRKQWGARPEGIAAVLGPCICSCCYRVDEERAAAFERAFGASGEKPVVRRDDGPYLDLQAVNVRLLSDAGVRNIAVCGDCTFTDERLGSFRREGPSFTRMMALCGYF